MASEFFFENCSFLDCLGMMESILVDFSAPKMESGGFTVWILSGVPRHSDPCRVRSFDE